MDDKIENQQSCTTRQPVHLLFYHIVHKNSYIYGNVIHSVDRWTIMAVSCCCALQHSAKCKMETKVLVNTSWFLLNVFPTEVTLVRNCSGASDNGYPAQLGR